MDRRRAVRLRIRPSAARSPLAGRQWTRMDLPTRDRAPADVATVPAREPGVPVPSSVGGAGPQPAPLSPRAGRRLQIALAAAILIALAAVCWHFNAKPRHQALAAFPDTFRVAAATLFVFGATGLGLVRLLLPAALKRYELLWVLPTGGCATGLALTVLGFA